MSAESATPSTLSYSTLPRGSRVMAEPDPETGGWTIQVPQGGIAATVLAILFTGAALLGLTAAVVGLIRRVPAANLNPAAYLKLACLGIVIVILWILAGIAIRQILRRRQILNVIRVSKNQLVLVTPELKDLTRQLSMDQVRVISIKALGVSPSLKQIGELVIELHDGTRLTLLRGRDVRELTWIQKVISEASGIERPMLEGFPA